MQDYDLKKQSTNEQFEVSDLKKKAQQVLPKEDIDTHEGDLYIKKTKESDELLKGLKNKDNGLLTTFKDQQTGETWYDIPFGNMGDDFKEKQSTTPQRELSNFERAKQKKEKLEQEVKDLENSWLTHYNERNFNDENWRKKSDELINKLGVDSASAGNMINDFNYIKEILVWATITEDIKNKQYRISIRSRGPEINRVAEKYNGGGHKMASGARVKSIDDAMVIMKDLDLELSKYKEKEEGK